MYDNKRFHEVNRGDHKLLFYGKKNWKETFNQFFLVSCYFQWNSFYIEKLKFIIISSFKFNKKINITNVAYLKHISLSHNKPLICC